MATDITIKAEIFNGDHLRDSYGPTSHDKVEISLAEARGSDAKFVVFRFEDTYDRTVAIKADDLRRALRALEDFDG